MKLDVNYNKREDNGFISICDYVLEHKDDIYLVLYRDEKYLLKFDSINVSDNGVSKDNIGYEEFNVLTFIEPDDSIFYMSYHNVPDAMLTDDNLVFNKKEFESRLVNQYDDVKTIQISFALNGLIDGTNIEDGSFSTGVYIVDNDTKIKEINKKASKIFMKVRDLNIGDLIVRDDDELRNSEKQKLIKLHDELIERLEEINDGSFIINDTFLVDFKEELNLFQEEFKFSKKDWAFINNGDHLGLNNVGAAYYTKGDYKAAFPHYLASAIMGSEHAISNLGYCFMYGRSVEKNMDLAVALFTIASNMGNVDSCYKLATLYRYDKNYKDKTKARKFLLKAFNCIYDNYYYSEHCSLCLMGAREKISGELFEKDLFGAYLLLLLAKEGYEVSIKDGFNLHEKQYNDTLKLLEDPMFEESKQKYEQNDEDSYIFGIYKTNPDKYHDEDNYKIGDSVVTLMSQYLDGNELPVGSVCYVLEVHRDYLLVEYEGFNSSPVDGVYNFTKDAVKKMNNNFN